MSLTARSVRRALVLAPVAEQKGRAALSIAAITLGVALGYGVQLINSVAAGEFEHALRVLSGNADLSLHGPRAGFPEELYPELSALPEVAAASPIIEFEARVAGKPEPLKLLAIDVFRAARIQPDLVAAEGGESIDFLRPDRVFLSRAAAQWLSVSTGDEITLQTGLARSSFKVAGLLSSASVRERIGVIDIAAAQSAFGRLGSITRLEIRLRPGARADKVAAQLRERLPPGLVIETPQALIERNTSLSRAYRVNLDVLALVAIFTGSLLVFSSQALAVVRRREEFALLRALGVTRRGVVGRVLLEAAVLGGAGAALGLALGQVLSGWVLQHYGADLGAGFFRGLDASVTLNPAGLALFGLLGIAAAVAGSVVAAHEAAGAEPARALRAGDEQNAFSRLNTVAPGATLVALGALLTLVPPVRGLPLGGYASILFVLLGTLSLMPRIAWAAFRVAPMRGPVPARLGLAQLRGAPGQAGVSLAAIVASVALMASMAIMVFSFRESLNAWLVRLLPAQLYLRIPLGSEATLISSELEAKLARLPGVARVQFTRVEQLVLSAQRAPVTLLARDIDRLQAERFLPLLDRQRLPAAGEPAPAWVSEALADLYQLRIGSALDIPIGGRTARFTVAGIWRDYIRQQGAILIEREQFAALTGSRNASEAAFWAEPGTGTGELASRIRAALPAGLEADLLEPGQLREISLRIFDRTFGVTYALEAVAVLIGLVALSASFGALALARRREFGMLRHLGMTRRQIGAMLAFEGTLVSALGVGTGLVLGWIISLVLIHVVNRQSFHWSMDLYLPWAPLCAFTAAMIALASLSAWIGARKAMGGEAVRAVSEAW
jgi:putative ABC transport system permease protein